MHRLASVIGSLLVLAGAALLVYVGINYAGVLSIQPHTWSSQQKHAGKQLASRLGHHQTVAVPRAPRAVAPGEPALRMVIPKIGVDSRVVQTPPVAGIWAVADWAVGHLSTTPGPGLPGNGAYAAHDDIKGEIFKRAGDLSPGDSIVLFTRHMRYRYAVVSQRIVPPSDVSVLAQTRTSTITLVTCTPYWVDTNRLIVQAVLKSSSPV